MFEALCVELYESRAILQQVVTSSTPMNCETLMFCQFAWDLHPGVGVIIEPPGVGLGGCFMVICMIDYNKKGNQYPWQWEAFLNYLAGERRDWWILRECQTRACQERFMQ